MFLIRLNLFAIPLYLIIMLRLQLYALREAIAIIVSNLLQLSGISASLSGTMIAIQNGSFAADIVWDCTGWKSIFAFFALVFATSFELRKKLFAMAFLPVIFIINIFRIWFMFYYVHTFGLFGYDVVHTVIWSWGLIIVVLLLWVIWLKWADKTLLMARKNN